MVRRWRLIGYFPILYNSLRPCVSVQGLTPAPVAVRPTSVTTCVSGSLTRRALPLYSDEKVANRDTQVWHGATEKNP
jgi:hypothetical protein